MDKIKRTLSFNESCTKKLRTNEFNKTINSLSSIETFPNEIFYEIFDYLNGCDIYSAFSNLNYRFQQFFNSSSFLLKIKFYFISNHLFLNNYKHKILSLNLWPAFYINDFFSWFIIDSSFDRLESIILPRIKQKTLLLVLKKLIYLPRLFSLSIEFYDTCDVYQSIFTLPMLKYLKVTSLEYHTSLSLPIAINNQQLNTIKILIINHSCTFNELATILSYTHQLTHLNFMHFSGNDSNIEMILSITLSNLIYISMNVIFLEFDKIEMFMKKISSKLKILRFSTRSQDQSYLLSNRWEEFILQHLPYLEKFYFTYNINIDYQDELIDFPWQSDLFISPFWIARKWIFEGQIEDEESSFLIKPYKKRWYEFINVDRKSNMKPATLLSVQYIPFYEYVDDLLDQIFCIRSITSIYHLEFCQTEIFIGSLMRIIRMLPNLDSLKIWSVLLPQSTCLSIKDRKFLRHIKYTNKITKVYLEKNLTKFEEVLFIIDLFPRMKYLQVSCTSFINIQLFIQAILIKIRNKSKRYHRLLAFCISTASDEMVKTLQKMIDCQKLLFNYTIKRVYDTIYLQWK
ncbi:unnamed protein product [Rotaria sp. Silwood1]|nr:unnamed protein product [Rotaria sp. Silwood1]